MPSSPSKDDEPGRASNCCLINRCFSSRRVTWAILAVAFLALATAIILSPRERVFDEGYYFAYVELLHRHGLSMTLLE